MSRWNYEEGRLKKEERENLNRAARRKQISGGRRNKYSDIKKKAKHESERSFKRSFLDNPGV